MYIPKRLIVCLQGNWSLQNTGGSLNFDLTTIVNSAVFSSDGTPLSTT